MARQIVSLICTVLNEEKTIKDFLSSLLKQTFPPDEIIIVDGGSKDKTFEILKEYERKYPDLIKIYQLKGANIAQGRNFAIEKAKGMIIVTVDAGCIYDENFVREIVKPLLKFLLENSEKFGLKREKILSYLREKKIDTVELEKEESAEFVQGVYYPYYASDFEYFAGFMLVKPPERQFKVPSRTSARATAFFKYVWKGIGGYPDKFVTGEDTRFHLEILKKGFKWVMKKEAICYWRMPRNLGEFYKKFEKYAIGDVLQGNLLKYKRLLLLFLGFWFYVALLIYFIFYSRTLFSILILLLLFYLFGLGVKYLIKTRKLSAIFYIPLLEFVKRIAYQIGFIKGIIIKATKQKN